MVVGPFTSGLGTCLTVARGLTAADLTEKVHEFLIAFHFFGHLFFYRLYDDFIKSYIHYTNCLSKDMVYNISEKPI